VEGELRLVAVPVRQHGDLHVRDRVGAVQHGQRQRLGDHLALTAQSLQDVAWRNTASSRISALAGSSSLSS
jgi:hypothetical protein